MGKKSLLLTMAVVSMVMAFSVNPASAERVQNEYQYASIQPRIGGSGTHMAKDLQSSELIEGNKFIGYHPDFTTWLRRDFYYFGSGTKNVNFSVGIAGKMFSLSASVSKPGSGSGLRADVRRDSRPAIYANVVKKKYKVGLKKNSTGQWTGTPRIVEEYALENADVKIDYR